MFIRPSLVQASSSQRSRGTTALDTGLINLIDPLAVCNEQREQLSPKEGVLQDVGNTGLL